MRLAVALASQGTRDTRWGKPEEIANLIVFAVSNAASYINGAAFVADDAMDKSQGMNRKSRTGFPKRSWERRFFGDEMT